RAVELARRASFRKARFTRGEEVGRPLLEGDGGAEDARRVVGYGKDSRPVDRRLIDVRHGPGTEGFYVIAAGEQRHVLALHRREPLEQLLQIRVLRLLGRADIEGHPPELDLEGAADRFHLPGSRHRGRLLLGLQASAATRAHPVREGEVFADLRAPLAAPADGSARAADVLLVGLDGAAALRAGSRLAPGVVRRGGNEGLGLLAGDRPFLARL